MPPSTPPSPLSPTTPLQAALAMLGTLPPDAAESFRHWMSTVPSATLQGTEGDAQMACFHPGLGAQEDGGDDDATDLEEKGDALLAAALASNYGADCGASQDDATTIAALGTRPLQPTSPEEAAGVSFRPFRVARTARVEPYPPTEEEDEA